MNTETKEKIEILERKRDLVVKVITFTMMGHLDLVPMNELIEVLNWTLNQTSLQIHELTLEGK